MATVTQHGNWRRAMGTLDEVHEQLNVDNVKRNHIQTFRPADGETEDWIALYWLSESSQ